MVLQELPDLLVCLLDHVLRLLIDSKLIRFFKSICYLMMKVYFLFKVHFVHSVLKFSFHKMVELLLDESLRFDAVLGFRMAHVLERLADIVVWLLV